jgi:hypothetical protein
MTPDGIVAEYKAKGGKITLQMLRDRPDHYNQYILFEGNASALEFLGRLFIAQAKYKTDCEFHLAPIGQGGVFFSKDSNLGIFIHRLPCTYKKGFRLARPTPMSRKTRPVKQKGRETLAR